MAAPKPSYQQRLFNDDELITSEHDKIVRWADIAAKQRPGLYLSALGIQNAVNPDGKVCAWSRYKNYWAVDELTEYPSINSALEAVAKSAQPKLPFPPPVSASHVAWEGAIKTERGAVVGLVDLVANLEIPVAQLRATLTQCHKDEICHDHWVEQVDKHSSDLLCCDGSRFWIHHKDVTLIDIDQRAAQTYGPCVISGSTVYRLSDIHWSKDQNEKRDLRIFVEAKTKIRSAGELIRQINLYKSHTPSGTYFFVVAPAAEWDAEVRKIVEENQIFCLTYLSNE